MDGWIPRGARTELYLSAAGIEAGRRKGDVVRRVSSGTSSQLPAPRTRTRFPFAGFSSRFLDCHTHSIWRSA